MRELVSQARAMLMKGVPLPTAPRWVLLASIAALVYALGGVSSYALSQKLENEGLRTEQFKRFQDQVRDDYAGRLRVNEERIALQAQTISELQQTQRETARALVSLKEALAESTWQMKLLTIQMEKAARRAADERSNE